MSRRVQEYKSRIVEKWIIANSPTLLSIHPSWVEKETHRDFDWVEAFHLLTIGTYPDVPYIGFSLVIMGSNFIG